MGTDRKPTALDSALLLVVIFLVCCGSPFVACFGKPHPTPWENHCVGPACNGAP